MKTIKRSLGKRLLAYAVLTSMAWGPAFAGTTDISNVPLASSTGTSVLPNLLFTLDNSGSMGWDFLPDYVDSGTSGLTSFPCLATSGNSTRCTAGDPPYYAGGENGFNGVGYDPKLNYQPALNSDGTTKLAAPLSTTALPIDAYGVQSTGTVNLTSGITDKKFCNSAGTPVCKRNGADASGNVLAAGTDGFGRATAAGQFPYRTNPSNSSTVVFALPEMMSKGTFVRSGSASVTVTTVEPHGLTTSDTVYVASPSGVTVNCAPVTAATTNTFAYTSGATTAVNAVGSYRKCVSGSFSQNSGTVTVTSGGHGLVVNDVISVFPASGSFSTGSFTVTAVTANTFSYSSSNGTGPVTGPWVRTGLYNVSSTVSGPAISYYITPVEYCTDHNLTTCTFVAPGSTPPTGYTFPAYVRFCQDQLHAVAPAGAGTGVAVTGNDASGNAFCRSKYVNSGVMTVTYLYPRYGWFTRDTIQSSVTSYANRTGRGDCAAAPTCTYTEEIQNYARWYTYYRTRIQMMKTAVGRAFLSFVSNPSASPSKPDTIRVGFITIHAADSGSVSSSQYLRIDNFNTTQAANFYTKLYAQGAGNATPLQEALSRAGWIFAGKLNTGLTAGIPNTDDPVQASCQRNFTLMTTDGFWNGALGQTLAGRSIGNPDGVNPTIIAPYTAPTVDHATTGTFDGGGATTTTVTPVSTVKEQKDCVENTTTTFGSGSGTQTSCGCLSGQHRIIERDVITGNTVVSVEGVVTSNATGTTTQFQNVTSCVPTPTTTTTTPVTETEQNNCRGNNQTGFTSGANGGGTQITCGCTGNNRQSIRRVLQYNKIVTTTTGGGSATTYSANTSQTFTTLTACGTTNSLPSPNPSIANGTASTTPDPGTTLTIALMPNPQTVSGGTPTSTTTPGGTPNTLADVALYYYENDLRGGTDQNGDATGPSRNLGGTGTVDVSPNNVPTKTGAKDFVTHQHMTTFTVGMADGLMDYQTDYDTASTGDFFNIKQGTLNGCFWTPGFCDWPAPTANDPSALDDLWHAAVNGRGQYFQALNASALAASLSGALSALNAQVAAAAASATSSPNVTQTDNQIFSTTYETVTWSGKVFAQTIDPTTGNVSSTTQWQADTQLLSQVAPTSDTRNLYTRDSTSTSGVKLFNWASLNATEQAMFTGKCTSNALSQCTNLTSAQLTTANDGQSLVGFLRGQTGNEGTVFRDRIVIDPATNATLQTVLGDTISAKPAFVRRPTFNYVDSVTPTYASFAALNATRAPRVYVGANDGYLHAFDAATGAEAWAYAPRFLMSGLYQLADTNYASHHTFFVDGSPVTGDVFDAVNGAWKTILVGGANGGGRGFYALDITDPTTPKGLWEYCSSSTDCGANSDADLGYSFGDPVIGKRSFDGKWVVIVTSGLNNASPGSGGGFFYVLDAITGALLNKVPTNVGATNVGTATTPSGLMKASAFFENALTDATFQYVYAGDQLGNVWRLDTGTNPPTVLHLATLTDGSTPPRAQPITTQPSLTHISSNRVLYIGTGRYLGTSDLTDPGALSGVAYQQSLYAFKDRGTDYGNLRADPNMVVQTLSLISPTERGITQPQATVNWTSQDGWRIDFNPPTDPSPGERVNIDPRLVLGTLVVITNTPSGGGTCAVGGSSREYNLDFKTGGPVANAVGGVVGSSLGGTIAVGMAIVQLPSGAIKDIVTGADTSKTTTVVNVNSSGSSTQRFSYRIR